MELPRGKGWEWLSRARSIAWLLGALGAGVVTVWSHVEGLAPPVIAVFALAAFALVLVSAAAAKHLFADAPPLITTPSVPGSRSEEYVVESLRKAENDRRRLEEEARKEREKQGEVLREFNRLQKEYERTDASRQKLEQIFTEVSQTVDRLMEVNEGAQRTLYAVDKALRAADLDAVRHWRPPQVKEGWPISTEDAVRWASYIVNEYRRERVAEVERNSKPPTDQ